MLSDLILVEPVFDVIEMMNNYRAAKGQVKNRLAIPNSRRKNQAEKALPADSYGVSH